MNNLLQLVVEESLHLPSMFTLVFQNSYFPGDTEAKAWQVDGKEFDALFSIGKTIEIGFTSSTTDSTEFEEAETGTVFKGEITGIETHFTAGAQAPVIIRGYDASHRLHRGRYNRSFQNMTDTDIVKKIAGEAGISTGTVDASGGPYGYGDINGSNGYTFQSNQTNMEFMRKLAFRNGFELFMQDGKLNFRKPKKDDTVKLEWLKELHSFSVRVSSAEQVSEVEVRGWNYKTKKPIVETATSASLFTSNDYGEGKKQSSAFSGKPSSPKMVLVDQAIAEASEAKAIAQAVCNELGGEYVQADAHAEGNPKIRPGRVVELKDLNKYSGKYYVAETRHVFQEGVYATEFSVRGLRGNDLFSTLTADASTSSTHPQHTTRVGIVTDNNDPNKWGRVRVKFPALTDEHASYWARVVSAGAGAGRGFDCLPEINDEVLVAFENGDIHRPYVIGGVWNGTDAPPESVTDSVANGKVRLRTFKTRVGHRLQFVEEDKGSKKGVYLDTVDGHYAHFNDTEKFLEIKTKGGHQLKLDDQGKTALLKTTGGHTLEMKDAGSSVTLKSTGTMTIEAAQSITIKVGSNSIKIDNTGITAQSSLKLDMKGTTVNVEGTGSTAVKSTGILQVQGSLVKIN